MNEETKVPEEILAIIDAKMTAEAEAKQARAVEQMRVRAEEIERGRLMLADRIAEGLKEVAPWLGNYDRTAARWNDDDMRALGCSRDKKAGITLTFEIPGLIPFRYSTEFKQWLVGQAHDSRGFNDDMEPSYGFNSSYWTTCSIEDVLVASLEEGRKLQEYLDQYEKRREENAKYFREQQERDRASEQTQEKKSESEKAENERLVVALRSDPVMLSLVETFLLIRQDRAQLEAQVQDAYGHLGSMEERLTRRAADLRERAQEAERMAEEERNRALDLESDLSKAKKKIKETERGW